MKYNLIGIDGNAYSVMGYVVDAMKQEKFSQTEIEEYRKDAMSSDYNHLLRVSMDMIGECNSRSHDDQSEDFDEYDEYDEYDECDGEYNFV